MPGKARPRRTDRLREQTAHVRALAEYQAALKTLAWLNPDQGATIRQVSASTIRRACRSGALRAVKVGDTWRFTPTWLDDWSSAGPSPTTLRRAG